MENKDNQSDDVKKSDNLTIRIPVWMSEIMKLNPVINWSEVAREGLEIALTSPEMLALRIKVKFPSTCDFIDRIIIEKEDTVVNLMKYAETSIKLKPHLPETSIITEKFENLAERALEDIKVLKKIREQMICEIKEEENRI